MNNYEKIAKAYYKLLTSIDWDDDVLIAGLREGLNKFLSNAYLKENNEKKQLQGDYYSEEALRKTQNGDFTNLVVEHMVPKARYIQEPCEEMAQEGTLSEEKILELLRKYWKIAIITKEEDALLPSQKMPPNWDHEDIFARYNNAGITLTRK